MKFKDFKYIKLINYSNKESYEIIFYPFTIGFGVEYDDIELVLKIDNNIMYLDFTKKQMICWMEKTQYTTLQCLLVKKMIC